MFPYIDSEGWHVGPWPIQPFALLMTLGVAVAFWIAVRRAVRDGIAQEQFAELALWMGGVGFASAHLMAVVYTPDVLMEVARHPARLAMFLGGVSSFGAFAGGLIGAAAFFWRHGIAWTERLAFLDPIAFATPFGLSIGRTGCYLAHDHPGIRTSSWLGVRYPGGVRYDLGLLEVLFLLVLGGCFLWLDRNRRTRGFFAATFLVSYGVFRAVLDGLHVDPPRYFGWSVDQIASTAMIALGLAGFANMFWDKIPKWIRYGS